MILKDLQVKSEFLNKVTKNIEFNKIIGEFYRRLDSEVTDPRVRKKMDRLSECNKFWLLDVYQLQKIKDFKKTFLCKDKFCNNCKKVKQASRMARFIPEIEKYNDDGLYQIVLTTPNCSGDELKVTIKNQFKAFGRLIEFLKGKEKIKGLDFSSWGYKGAIRSLEVTFKGNSYHPHLHVLLCATGDMGIKEIENKYSVDYYNKREKRLFSENEVLLQKIWYLLINNIKVTKANINKLDIGYSCMIDEFKEDDYLELFKYMTKSKEEDNENLTYSNFKTLYKHLENIRQIQGYGCFFRIKDDDSIINEIEEIYNTLLSEIRQKESPVEVCETPQDLQDDVEYLLISRKKIFKYLKSE